MITAKSVAQRVLSVFIGAKAALSHPPTEEVSDLIKKVLRGVVLLAGIAAGIYLTGLGIVLQHLDEAMSRFDHQPTALSYLWWVVSAFGLAAIVACVWGGIRPPRRRRSDADVRCEPRICE